MLCKKCNINDRSVSFSGYQYSYCKKCNVINSQKTQKKFNYKFDKTPERRIKARIRYKLRNLLKKGKIRRDKCDLCLSEERLQFHHPDYKDPLLFLVLCENCHNLIHNKVIKEEYV